MRGYELIFCAAGSADTEMTPEEIRAGLREALAKLGERKRGAGCAAGLYAVSLEGW